MAASIFELVVAVYGGYFGGGIGIVNLAMLAAVGMTDIHAMNALKSILGIAINGIAALVFVAQGRDLLAAGHCHDRWARWWADISARTTRRSCRRYGCADFVILVGDGDDGVLLREGLLT